MTIQELVIMISLLLILSSAAIVRFVNANRTSIVVGEKALMRSLAKAAIAYNTANDSWYVMNSTDDIFAELLENPPPKGWGANCNDYYVPVGANIWRLSYCPGPPVIWRISCPHFIGPSCGGYCGTMWEFSVEGGRVWVSTLWRSHRWR